MKALSSTRTKKTNSKTQWVKAKNECKPHRGPNGQREWRPPKAFVHLPAAIFTRRTFCVPSKSSATNSFWTSSFNTYTKQLAAPSSLSCTKQFFYTRQLSPKETSTVHYTAFVSNDLCSSFYTRHFSLPRAFTQSNCYTKQVWHQPHFFHQSFCTW